MGDNHMCCVCMERESETLCLCGGAAEFLCGRDWENHCEKRREGEHIPIPVKAFPDAITSGYISRLKVRTSSVYQGSQELCSNLSIVADCISALSALCDQFTLLVQERISRLAEIRTALETQIYAGIEEEKVTHYEDFPNAKNPIVHALRDFREGRLVLFRYFLESNRLKEVLDSLCRYELLDPWSPADDDMEIQISIPKPGVRAEECVQVHSEHHRPDINQQYEKLVAVLPTKVLYFELEAKRWRSLMTLNHRIEVDNFSAATYISPDAIFVVGCSLPKTACYILCSGVAHRQPDLLSVRSSPGLLSLSSSVFAFGGTAHGKPTRSCEVFRTQSVVWERRSDMRESRTMFSPCLHQSIVYICGGYRPSIEIYDLVRDEFTLLRSLALPADFGESNCAAVGYCDSLVVLSSKFVCKLDTHTRKIYESLTHKPYEPWSRCSPIVVGSYLYITDLWAKVASIVNIDTGERTAQVAIPT